MPQQAVPPRVAGRGRATTGVPRWQLPFLLILHAVLLAVIAFCNSATFDEYAHVAAGFAYWRFGWEAFPIYALSPPLMRLLGTGLPALLAFPNMPPLSELGSVPLALSHWQYAELFLRSNFSEYARLVTLGRLGLIPVSCAAAWVVWRWARSLYGERAGLSACALYVLSPNVLAHASLVTTDAGTAAFTTLTAWRWWRYCRAPTARRLAWVAAAAAAAHLCKFSALLLWPLLLGMGACFIHAGVTRRGAVWRGLAAAGLTTLVVFNAAYGFRGTAKPLRELTLYSGSMQRWQAAAPWLRLPLPEAGVSGFDIQQADIEHNQSGGYEAYLFGRRYMGSRWWYYPAALACKLPVATILLFGLALLAGRRTRRDSAQWAEECSLLMAAAMFAVGFGALTPVNIGVRYLLPVFPLVFVFIGRCWQWPGRRSALAGALLAVMAIESLSAFPRPLAFVNVAAGGPSRAWQRLNDSNVDWGQSLWDLRGWMRAAKVSRMQLLYFGSVDPGAYGIRYTPLFWPGRAGEVVASDEPYVGVSSYFLVGLSHRVPTPQGRTERRVLPCAGRLSQQRPEAIAGHTIFIFRRDAFEAALSSCVTEPSTDEPIS